MSDTNGSIISSVFRIQPGEGERVGILLLFAIITVGGVTLTSQLISRSLFISLLPKSFIPYRYIFPAILIAVVMSVFARIINRFEMPKLMIGTFLCVQICALVFRLLIETRAGSSFAFLITMVSFFDIIGSIVMIQFWTYAADLFNTRQAKRLFGIIAGGGALASVLFGGFIGTIADSAGTKNLIFIVVGSLIACAACVHFLSKRYPVAEKNISSENISSGKAHARDTIPIVKALRSTPLIYTMMVMISLVVVAGYIAEYQLDLALKNTYENDSRAIIAYLARLSVLGGVIAMFLQFFLAPRLVERMSVFAMLSMLPLCMAAGAAATIASGGMLWAVSIMRVSELSLKYTLNDAAFNVLFLPIRPGIRRKVKALMDGVVKPPVIVGLGVIFISAANLRQVSMIYWSLLLFIVVLCWLFMIYRSSFHYVAALRDSIISRDFDISGEPVDLNDELTRRTLKKILAETNSPRVIHALSILRQTEDAGWNAHVRHFLKNDRKEVKIEAIRFLGENNDTEACELFKKLIHHPDTDIAGAAIIALARVMGHESTPLLETFLSATDLKLKTVALPALLNFGGLRGIIKAGTVLTALLESSESRDRAAAACVIATMQASHIADALIPLFKDPEPAVRIEALKAAEATAFPGLIPHLLPLLSQPRSGRRAIRAVVACAAPDCMATETILNNTELPIRLKESLLKKIVKQSAPHTARILHAHHDNPDDRLRGAIYAAFLNRRNAGYRVDLQGKALESKIRDELQTFYTSKFIQNDMLREDLNAPLLFEALETADQQTLQRLLILIVLLEPTLSYANIAHALCRHDERARANLVELFDTLLKGDVRELFLPLLTCPDSAGLAEMAASNYALSAGSAEKHLLTLAAHPSPWIRALSIHSFKELPLRDKNAIISNVLRKAAEDADMLVRETAATVLNFFENEFKGDAMPLTSIEKVLFLKSVVFFKELSGEEICNILPITIEKRIPKGTEFIRQGDAGESLFIIIEGEVAVTIDHAQQPATLKSGDVIGELAILTGEPRRATCRASSDLLCLQIDKTAFWELMREVSEVSIGVVNILLKYYREKEH